MDDLFDVAVIGAGPAGLAAALACAENGLRTIAIGPLSDPRDGRSAALMDGSINLLKRLGVWERAASLAAPLRGIRLVDATAGLVRAPEVLFEAPEIGLSAFGYNIPNPALTAALEATSHPLLTRLIDPKATVSDLGGQHAVLSTSTNERIKARLIIAADGRELPRPRCCRHFDDELELSPSRRRRDVRPFAAASWYFHRVASAVRAFDRRPGSRQRIEPRLGGRSGRSPAHPCAQ